MKKYLNLFKHVFLSMLFLWTSFTLLQIDFPDISELIMGIEKYMIKEQLSRQQETEPSLRAGWFCYHQDDYKAARKIMEPVAKTGNLSALYCLGLIDLKEGKRSEGISKLETVQEASPGHVRTLLNLAQAYYDERYYIKSINLLEQILKSDPTNQKALFLLGKTYMKTGKTEEAASVFKSISWAKETEEN